MKPIKKFIQRIIERLRWIHVVSFRLSADKKSAVKLVLGGLLFFLTDRGKSRLLFKADIRYNGTVRSFYFNDLTDFGLFYEIFSEDSYEFYEPEEINTIIDLGANIGVSALYFGLRYPSAEIHCFEPDPNNFSQLRKNVQLWGGTKIHDVAIWDKNGEMTFYPDPHRGSSSLLVSTNGRDKEEMTASGNGQETGNNGRHAADKERVTVKTKTLDQILDELNIDTVDLLKFDIEGAEEKVFNNFKSFDRIQRMIGELHGDRCNTRKIIDKIRNHFDNVEITSMNKHKRFYLKATK